MYFVFPIIQRNKYTLENPTYVALVDYSTAYTSVHSDDLSSALLKNDIRGNTWHHLRANSHDWEQLLMTNSRREMIVEGA